MTILTTVSFSTVEVMLFVILASMWLTFTVYFLRWFLTRVTRV
jgi:hypothetical protein